MKFRHVGSALLAMLINFTAFADPSPTVDPVTQLPLYPATHNIADPGNPVKMSPLTVCKSKSEGDFYNVYDARMDAAVAWCAANLTGFRTTHVYRDGRSRDTFYNADGTLVVVVLGSRGKKDENTLVYSISYNRYTPGLAEKTILGMNEDKIVCP